MEKEKILLVDDEPNIVRLLSAVLKDEGYEIKTAANPDDAKKLVESWRPDLVLLDLVFKGYEENGMDVLKYIKEVDPYVQVVIITGYGSINSAVEAIKLGAHDYLTKPLKFEEIKLLTKRALETRKVKLENIELKKEVERYKALIIPDIVGKDEKFLKALQTAKMVASSDVSVLITGESGTGKELIAKAIHKMSPRSKARFVAVNIGAIPEDLVESELFGHVKGSFTGAYKDKVGLFEQAHGGTIFLDEIAEASPKIQVKLLRVLQEGEFFPVGSEKMKKVDVRVIAATNKNLEELMRKGEFREDLYYRLNVVRINLPPLRERKNDIPLLVNYFLKRMELKYRVGPKTITRRVLNIFMNYDWPGNIRELENVVESMYIMTPGDVIDVDVLPDNIREKAGIETFSDDEIENLTEETVITLEELEKRYILKVLEVFKWNKKRAAEALGIDASTLYRKLKNYGISPSNK